jgi:adenosylhomocysteine nucleosidase
MRIVGQIRPDRPLFVLAVEEEAEFLGTELPVLLTGMGKVNAAVAVTDTLAQHPRPELVVNLGSAGALRPGLTGTHVVTRVVQHDLDSAVLRTLTGRSYGEPIALGDPDGVVLATGDAFIADRGARERLAGHAELVDMEGYAVAAAAAAAGVSVRIVKHVSDDADEGAAAMWRQSVRGCAQALAGWVERNM